MNPRTKTDSSRRLLSLLRHLQREPSRPTSREMQDIKRSILGNLAIRLKGRPRTALSSDVSKPFPICQGEIEDERPDGALAA
jgi:hypothetical protein